MEQKPEVTYMGALDMQICVPEGWTDEQAIAFANGNNPAGTANGWHIRREGSKYLAGDHERVVCKGRDSFVHIMLDC